MSANLHLITSQKKMLSLFNDGAVFCAFDTETSGQNPLTSSIIEIGAVKFNKDGILETFSSLINLQEPLNPFIKNLTGITEAMLFDAPLAAKIIPAFRNFCKETILVAHNAQFDLRFTNAESEKLNLLPLANQAIDTLRLSRLVLPDNKSWKQTFLASQFQIDTGHAHRAFDDARVCSELFKILVKMPAKKKARRKKQDEPSATAANLATLALQ